MWQPPKTRIRRILVHCRDCAKLHPNYIDVSPQLCDSCLQSEKAESALEELFNNQPKISRHKYDTIFDR